MGISTKYVNPYYLDDGLLKERSRYIESRLSQVEERNLDTRPIGFFMQINYLLSYFHTRLWAFWAILLAFMIIAGFSLNATNLGLFTGGFTSASIEIIILIMFQSVYGYIFRMAGVVITVFMAGLVVGALLRSRIQRYSSFRLYVILQIVFAIYCSSLPMIFKLTGASTIPDPWIILLFAFLTFIVSVITGLEFSTAISLAEVGMLTRPAKNYAADLFGAAFGIMITSMVLIPQAGLDNSCYLFILLNLVSAGLLILRRKKFVPL
jgi:spermidine synthase